MKVLMILSRFPYPLEKGDKLRAFQHLKMLSREHQVCLVAISDIEVSEDAKSKVAPYCSEIVIIRHGYFRLFMNLIQGFLNRLPIQVAYFYSGKAKKRIREVCDRFTPDIVFCQLIRTALYAKEIDANRKVIDFQDAFSAGTEQRLSKSGFWLRYIFKRELKLVRHFEQESYGWFQRHIVISANDRDQLSIRERMNVSVLPNGIDTEYYHHPVPEKKNDILFVGNMQYPPNVDAALFLVKEIMPLVWQHLPDSNVILCGADPVRQIRELAGPQVAVTGWVDEVRSYYNTSKIFVAPMRIGTGLQNKLLEAMASGMPCITTKLSAGPLGGTDGRDYLTGDTPQTIAEYIVTFMNDEALRKEIGENGYALVKANFSLDAASSSLLRIISK